MLAGSEDCPQSPSNLEGGYRVGEAADQAGNQRIDKAERYRILRPTRIDVSFDSLRLGFEKCPNSHRLLEPSFGSIDIESQSP
jgi:hypothetical protein